MTTSNSGYHAQLDSHHFFQDHSAQPGLALCSSVIVATLHSCYVHTSILLSRLLTPSNNWGELVVTIINTTQQTLH